MVEEMATPTKRKQPAKYLETTKVFHITQDNEKRLTRGQSKDKEMTPPGYTKKPKISPNNKT